MGGSAGEEPGSRVMAIRSCFPRLLHPAEPGPGHLPAYKSPRGYIDRTLAPSRAAEKAQWVGFNGPPPTDSKQTVVNKFKNLWTNPTK